jgi:hypothetical protein
VGKIVSQKCLILLARRKGFEPLTPRFEVWCSIQLSYRRLGDKGGALEEIRTPDPQIRRRMDAIRGSSKPQATGQPNGPNGIFQPTKEEGFLSGSDARI